ncbi:unconventional myosin-XVIIIb-like isoform X2 [Leptonychotes weddellii]|uniref:Unconventional myosin-XVIIIb-like isoform X2 n=1 Tax=Leptonychotes weddellii TaxID=9713 RepID=A0A7F8PXI9_LEPWE|nr:unconventional myosin-XVIIIb-like isoform X2 [Leptonychotes weddellii]
MAISSRLALWEQKIREEDKSPPPSSPPPLFSVIPGGFIKQLVRETEKESKEARLKKEAVLASPEQETPEISTSQPKSKSNSDTKSGNQQICQGNQSSSLQNSNIPGKESEGAGPTDPVLMTSINGEKPQESGPSGTPAKKPLPFKRGVRRGDVLLMVAKLDPDSAKPEQRTQPHDAPACKTPPPATDPGGEKKGETPGTPPGPQAGTKDTAPKAEKTQTEGVADPGMVLPTKQGAGAKGGRAPQTKGLKGGELQGREGPGEGGWQETAEKGEGDPPNTMAKGNLSKDAGEGKWAGAQIQVRKWGGSLGRRSKWDGPQSKKDKEGMLPGKAEKSEDPQIKAEKVSKGQGKPGKVGEVPGQVEKAGEPQSVPGKAGEPQAKVGKEGPPQGESVEAGKAGGKTEKSRKGPEEVGARRETPAAAGKEGWPDSRGQKAGEPCAGADDGAEAPEMELEGRRPPALEGQAERSQTRKESEEGPALPEGSKGGKSEDSDQAPEDRWYEAEKVWLVQKDGFTLATVLKPDEGTADLPAGRVRLCIDADKTITEVDEEHVHRANPPELDQAEDLASLVSVNESSVLNTLLRRYRAQLPHTFKGPDLIVLQPPGPPAPSAGKVPRGRRDGLPAHLGSLAQRAYWALLSQRRDQSIVALGRSGAGKTTCCEQVLEHLVAMAGSVDGRVSVEKIRATFTILRAFGSVSTGHSCNATRVTMVMSLDFNATGRVTAAQLQTMLLEKSRVARQPEGEGNFEVFSQMLAGLDLDLRTELYLHQMADSSSFGMGVWPKVRRGPSGGVVRMSVSPRPGWERDGGAPCVTLLLCQWGTWLARTGRVGAWAGRVTDLYT